jgi:hypothetical protein
MAPEFPPGIVIFDLKLENGRLLGSLEYVESADPTHRFTLNWSALVAPKGYREIGGGVAYVQDFDDKRARARTSFSSSATSPRSWAAAERSF